MKETEMHTIAGWISQVLANAENAAALSQIRGQVRDLGRQFPAPTTAE
jgi:glycine/serine hydroxymethyltransferase